MDIETNGAISPSRRSAPRPVLVEQLAVFARSLTLSGHRHADRRARPAAGRPDPCCARSTTELTVRSANRLKAENIYHRRPDPAPDRAAFRP